MRGRPLDLLGRHVAGRAEQHAGARQLPRLAGEARDAEVDHGDALHVAVAEEEVARLDVAVHHAARVGARERLHRALQTTSVSASVRRCRARRVGEILALEPLHRQVVLARVGDAVGGVADDVRVIELGEDRRLAHEALDVDRVLAVEDLERDRPLVEAIVRAEHRPHPPGARLVLEDEPTSDDRPRYQRASHTTAGGRPSRSVPDRLRIDTAGGGLSARSTPSGAHPRAGAEPLRAATGGLRRTASRTAGERRSRTPRTRSRPAPTTACCGSPGRPRPAAGSRSSRGSRP